ncbi:PrgI family protein [Candidatus Peregrinibacteria bacterium]|jgi:hypothetical protein|nr:PrgI family protein [Candidatus Peregrinibacteria bacterium]
MQYKIPQDVQREDQILSFLTMRQLGILAIGGTICYIIFVALSPHFFVEIWGAAMIIPGGLTLAIAFLSIGGVSFSKWMLLLLEKNFNPQKRIWNNRHSVEEEIHALVNSSAVKKADLAQKRLKKQEVHIKKQKTLSELVQDIDEASHTDDILEDSLQKIKEVRPTVMAPEDKTNQIIQENMKKISSAKQ